MLVVVADGATAGELLVQAGQTGMAASTLVLGSLFAMLGARGSRSDDRVSGHHTETAVGAPAAPQGEAGRAGAGGAESSVRQSSAVSTTPPAASHTGTGDNEPPVGAITATAAPTAGLLGTSELSVLGYIHADLQAAHVGGCGGTGSNSSSIRGDGPNLKCGGGAGSGWGSSGSGGGGGAGGSGGGGGSQHGDDWAENPSTWLLAVLAAVAFLAPAATVAELLRERLAGALGWGGTATQGREPYCDGVVGLGGSSLAASRRVSYGGTDGGGAARRWGLELVSDCLPRSWLADAGRGRGRQWEGEWQLRHGRLPGVTGCGVQDSIEWWAWQEQQLQRRGGSGGPERADRGSTGAATPAGGAAGQPAVWLPTAPAWPVAHSSVPRDVPLVAGAGVRSGVPVGAAAAGRVSLQAEIDTLTGVCRGLRRAQREAEQWLGQGAGASAGL